MPWEVKFKRSDLNPETLFHTEDPHEKWADLFDLPKCFFYLWKEAAVIYHLPFLLLLKWHEIITRRNAISNTNARKKYESLNTHVHFPPIVSCVRQSQPHWCLSNALGAIRIQAQSSPSLPPLECSASNLKPKLLQIFICQVLCQPCLQVLTTPFPQHYPRIMLSRKILL